MYDLVKEAAKDEEGPGLSEVDKRHVRNIQRELENRSAGEPMTVEEAMEKLEDSLRKKLNDEDYKEIEKRLRWSGKFK